MPFPHQNQLCRAHGGSQRLKQQLRSLHGSVLSPLHVCYGVGVWEGLLTVGLGHLRLFCLFLGTISIYWVPHPSLMWSLCLVLLYGAVLCSVGVPGRLALFWAEMGRSGERAGVGN